MRNAKLLTFAVLAISIVVYTSQNEPSAAVAGAVALAPTPYSADHARIPAAARIEEPVATF